MIVRAGLLLSCCLWLSAQPSLACAQAQTQESPRPQEVDRPADAAATPQDMPFLGGFLREKRILYPLRNGEWQAAGEHRYDEPAYGVSVRYVHGDDKDRWIDLYFYPVGVIDDAQLATAAASERYSIVALRGVPGGFDALDMGELRTFALPPRNADDNKPRVAYSADMTYTRDGQASNSALTLFVDRLYFVKGRLSIDAAHASRDDVRGLLEHFMTGLAPQLQFVSSGACWRPLPIEPLPEGPPPAGSILSMREGEAAGSVFVLPDKVLARDPASPQARLMMMLGMSRLGRLYPGCDSSEPTNPDVPDGLREIRLEYRAPATQAAPADVRPVRPRRRGVG